ncbi:hypothetical protein OS493_016908 [Desmophyllum pertusum]|uniref:Uncharacterized protein n=1 Tax=Desmophyllum pertusum TaxID=174260 RepID=A0A9X0CK10_9CNID|nr:hypothetical protein OS493_016908 [Desmophyllum pertusum]
MVRIPSLNVQGINLGVRLFAGLLTTLTDIEHEERIQMYQMENDGKWLRVGKKYKYHRSRHTQGGTNRENR